MISNFGPIAVAFISWIVFDTIAAAAVLLAVGGFWLSRLIKPKF